MLQETTEVTRHTSSTSSPSPRHLVTPSVRPPRRHAAEPSPVMMPFVLDTWKLGLAGESDAAQLLYLALTTRLLEHPVSVVVKGPSAGGKSFLVETVLKFFPPEACYTLSAMSERALIYGSEPLAQRFLWISEAAGVRSEFTAYLMRTLLSEGKLRYETLESTRDGLKPRLIERAGPTGLLLTTTALKLDSEIETRMLTVSVSDDEWQTSRVLSKMASGKTEAPKPVDLTAWVELQRRLGAPASCRPAVTIPFAETLASKIPPLAPRIKRDFRHLLSLIEAHALLREAVKLASRKDAKAQGEGSGDRGEGSGKGETGGGAMNCATTNGAPIVATLEDYAAVRELLIEPLNAGLQGPVSRAVKETVDAVAKLSAESPGPVSVRAVAARLGVRPGTAARWVKRAIHHRMMRAEMPRMGMTAGLVAEGCSNEMLPPVHELA